MSRFTSGSRVHPLPDHRVFEMFEDMDLDLFLPATPSSLSRSPRKRYIPLLAIGVGRQLSGHSTA